MKPNYLLTVSGIIGALLMAGQTHGQSTLDRGKQPPGQPVPTVKLPAIQKFTLPNGLKVLLVENHELPLVAFNLVVNAGTEFDPLDQPGLSSMTADMMDEGTKSRTALQIADEIDFIGASMDVRATTDGTFASLNTLTKHTDAALNVFADVLLHPTFPQAEFDRIKNQRLTSILQQKDQPGTIASNAFSYVVYGPQHPYGINSSGTESSISNLTRENLVSFYGSHYLPNNATMVVVGDVSLASVTPKLEKAFSSWKKGETRAASFPPTPSVDRRRVYMIDKPGAAQSEIRIGYPALARNTEDFQTVNLMNRVLGGQFSSRLNISLREKHGYTYGARSSFSFNKKPGPFIANAAVTTAKTDSSILEFLSEIDLMHNEGVTADELAFVKKGLTGNFALSFETPSQVANALRNLVLYDLPNDYYQTYLQAIDKVTLDEVKGAAKKYLDSSKMAVVFVGDLSVVRESVEKMNFGETVLCDTDGKKINP